MRKQTAILTALILAFCSLPVFAGELPDAPTPKREAVKFSAASAFFTGGVAMQIIGQRHGAALCRMEARRAGVPGHWNIDKTTGLAPRDNVVFEIGGGILATATVLELTGHKKLAKEVLLYGGTLWYGIGGATYWAGCN